MMRRIRFICILLLIEFFLSILGIPARLHTNSHSDSDSHPQRRPSSLSDPPSDSRHYSPSNTEGLQIDNLQFALAGAAGVYMDPTVAPHFQKTVLVTAGNFGYLNHIHNFKCYLDRMKFKAIVFAFDERAYKYLQNITTGGSNIYPALLHIDNVGQSVEFRQGAFQKLTLGKFAVVHEVIRAGYNVVFSDPDVAIIRDPMEYFNIPGVDYIHSINAKCQFTKSWNFQRDTINEGNTGFYFIRSNTNTIKLYSMFFISAKDAPSDIDDQTLFWAFLRRLERNHRNSPRAALRIEPLNSCRAVATANKKSPTTLYTCPLDFCSFASGIIGSDKGYDLATGILSRDGKPLITNHANYMVGNEKKQLQLNTYGYWLATKRADGKSWDGECLPFNPSKGTGNGII